VERTLHKLAETLYKANEAGKGQADAASAGASGGSAAGAAQSNKPGDVMTRVCGRRRISAELTKFLGRQSLVVSRGTEFRAPTHMS